MRRAIAAFALTLCLGAPVLELLDRWDPVDQPGGDSELVAMIVAVCVGVALATAAAFVHHLPSVGRATFESQSDVPGLTLLRQHRIVLGSPPTNLRV